MCLANVHTSTWAWIAKQVPVIAICVVAIATLGRTRRPATFVRIVMLVYHSIHRTHTYDQRRPNTTRNTGRAVGEAMEGVICGTSVGGIRTAPSNYRL